MIAGKIVAIDFDGTITEHSQHPVTGAIRPHCKEAIDTIRKHNTVVIWTARSGQNLQEAIGRLKAAGITYDAINIDVKGGMQRKIEADIFIDDRALFTPQEIDWAEIEQIFTEG